MGIATEIVSISVSFAELLVLPVWGNVSTSRLFFSKVGRRQYRWMWIGCAGRLCRSRLHHVHISSLLFSSPTYNYFRFASAILNLQVHQVHDVADVCTTEKMRTKITGISSLAGTEPKILLGVINPLPHLQHTLLRYKNTLAIGGLRPIRTSRWWLCWRLVRISL